MFRTLTKDNLSPEYFEVLAPLTEISTETELIERRFVLIKAHFWTKHFVQFPIWKKSLTLIQPIFHGRPLQNHRKTDNSLIALFTLNTSTKISTILEIQLGKMLHSYKKSASNQGALYDSAKRNEVRQRLRLVFLSSTKGEIERWRFQ